jgi:fructokinase
VLDHSGAVILSERISSPQGDYEATIRALAGIVRGISERIPTQPSVGIGMPGSISPKTGRVQNSNSTWINGQNFKADIEAAVGRVVRCANDANCFALSEAIDGAGQGHRIVFGVILGTGTGGGVIVDQRVVDGPRGTGGEWGHTPLPWAEADEQIPPRCWCGLSSCLETWLSGTALERTYREATGRSLKGDEIARAGQDGADPAAAHVLKRHAHRLARGLAMICNIVDPDVIVLGGGLSNMPHLYRDIPGLMAPYLFTDTPEVEVRPPRWGDAGGVRGAAWLWGGPLPAEK